MTTGGVLPPPVKSLGTLAGKWEIGRGLYGDTNGQKGMPLLYLRRRVAGQSGITVTFDTVVGGSLDVGRFVRCVLDEVPEPTATALLKGATTASPPDSAATKFAFWVGAVEDACEGGTFLACSGLVPNEEPAK
jgi:hypothetical protein